MGLMGICAHCGSDLCMGECVSRKLGHVRLENQRLRSALASANKMIVIMAEQFHEIFKHEGCFADCAKASCGGAFRFVALTHAPTMENQGEQT